MRARFAPVAVVPVALALLLHAGACRADLLSGMAALSKRDYAGALAEFQPAAQRGSAVAQVGLGYLYEHGFAVPQAYDDAHAWYRKAAQQGNGQAMARIARLYTLGLGVQDNMIVAVDWFRKAAEAGDGEALRGALLPPDMAEKDAAKVTARLAGAQRYFAGKAAQGDITAQLDLGYMYMRGLARERDGSRGRPGLALEWLGKAAERGYAGAQVLLAYALDAGRVAGADPLKAQAWYEQAANKGNAFAQYSLASLLATAGSGSGIDPATARQRAVEGAVQWAARAAEQGLVPAQTLLASLLLEGSEADSAAALVWLNRAAAEADEGALVRLGDECLSGRALPRDYAAARDWYLKAIETADSAAAYARLGRMRENGLGMPADSAEAFRLYARAAQSRSPDVEPWVHARLADMYERGNGTQADPAKAFHEYAMAAIGGDRSSMERLVEAFENGQLGQEADAKKALTWRERLARAVQYDRSPQSGH